MDHRPSIPFQHQPWSTSKSSSPLPIPSPRLHPVTPSVHTEWQKLRSSQSQNTRVHQFRSHTPPSLSPSPAPSTSSYYYDSDIEIEELTDSPSEDSGIELLIGEYEEAPENYGKTAYDSADEDTGKGHRSILYGLEKLNTARETPRHSKRSYAESSGEESGSSYDSGISSVDSNWGRRVRRRVVKRSADDCISVCSFDGGSNNSSDNEIDMEL